MYELLVSALIVVLLFAGIKALDMSNEYYNRFDKDER